MTRLTNAGLMLDIRLQRWPNIEPTFVNVTEILTLTFLTTTRAVFSPPFNFN